VGWPATHCGGSADGAVAAAAAAAWPFTETSRRRQNRSCGDEPTTSREWNDKSLTLRSVNGSDNTR